MAFKAPDVQLLQAPAWAGEEILENVRSMYNCPEFSDVTFVCSDGERLPGCRLFLSARSPMLKGMLTNGMSESRSEEITLPDVSSPVMRTVLEFLYTGSITYSTWKLALEVIVAAKFFLLKGLETVLWDCVVNGPLASSHVELTEAASRLTDGVTFSHLWDSTKDFLLQELVQVLDSGCGKSFLHLRSLSQQAFEYYLEQTQRDYENAPPCSVATYLRLRQISLWCAGRLVPPQDTLVSTFLPTAKSLSAVLQAPEKGGKGTKLSGDIREALAASIEPWLSRVKARAVASCDVDEGGEAIEDHSALIDAETVEISRFGEGKRAP